MKNKNEYRLYFRGISTHENFIESFDRYLKTGDGIYLNNSCFLCQQSLEFLLKGILQYFGINNFKNLNKIEDLFNSIVNNCPVEFKLDNSLLNYSNILNDWKHHKNTDVSLSLIRNINLIYKNIEKTFIEYGGFCEN